MHAAVESKYLTTEESAERLGVSYWTFRRWARRYRLPRMGTGRIVRYSRESVDRLAQQLTKQTR